MAGGRPPIYDANFHPNEIIRLMKEQGYFAVQVARDWGITTETIHDWARDHVEFSAAYTRAKQCRAAWWFDKAQQGIITGDGEHFNSQLFGQVMRYDGVSLDERIVKLPALAECKTFGEQSTCIIGALACGQITLKEANAYVDIIGKCARIDEVTELRRMLEEIEAAKKQGR